MLGSSDSRLLALVIPVQQCMVRDPPRAPVSLQDALGVVPHREKKQAMEWWGEIRLLKSTRSCPDETCWV